jgi:hypothetical protein
MACCHHVDASCASVSADDCCAAGEQRQNVHATALPALIPPTMSGQLMVWSPCVLRAVNENPRTLADGPAPYLLDSVFRI